LGTLTIAVPVAARGDEGGAEREAQVRFEEGIARVKAGNFEGARMSFAQAYAVVRKPTILWNLALAEEKSRHIVEALEHFKEFARGNEDQGGVDKHIADLMAQTGHLDVAAPTAAQVTVDGSAVGSAPMRESIDVLPGRHHVEARSSQSSRDADVDVGAAQVLRVDLMPPVEAPPAPPSPPAPSAGEASASAPATPPPPPPPPPPAAASDRVEGGDFSAPRLIAVALVGTATVVSGALGAYFALQSQSDQATAAAFRNQHSVSFCSQITTGTSGTCAAWNNAVQSQGRDAMLSDVFYVVGGVLAVGGVATWFLWPTAGPTSVGLGAAGRF
jgi:hypothetical protein